MSNMGANSSDGSDGSAREAELRTKRICRMCLSTEAPLTDLYSNENRLKSRVPLPLQIMASVSLEIFTNDGLPRTICDPCRQIIDYCYRFKQVCRKADTLLKQFPLTGVWSEKLALPIYPPELLKSAATKAHLTPLKRKAPATSAASGNAAKRPNTSVSPEPILLNAKPPSRTANRTAKVVTGKTSSTSANGTILVAATTTSSAGPVVLHNTKVAAAKAQSALNSMHVQQLKTPPTAGRPRILNNTAKAPLTAPKTPSLKHTDDGNLELVLDSSSTSISITDAGAEAEAEADAEADTSAGDVSTPAALTINTECYPCAECKRTFPLQQMLDMHMQRHKRTRNAECEICHKRFFTKYDLSKHALVHTGGKRFTCAVCQLGFSRANLLERHELTHKEAFRHSCGYCQKQFANRDDLERHEFRHKIVRKFQCAHCDKSFAFKQGLDRHEVIHAKKQPFPCSYCGAGFSTNTKLSRHLTEHAGPRPFPCRLCIKSFLMPHHLDRHMRSHKAHMERDKREARVEAAEGRRRREGSDLDVEDDVDGYDGVLECMVCDAHFGSYGELMEHSEQHAIESGSCPFCKMQLHSTDEIAQHMCAHAEQQFACEFCDLMFASDEHKEEHCAAEHADEQELYATDAKARADAASEVGLKPQRQPDDDMLLLDATEAGEEILHELIVPEEGAEFELDEQMEEGDYEEHVEEEEEAEAEGEEEELADETVETDEHEEEEPVLAEVQKPVAATRRPARAAVAPRAAGQPKILNYIKQEKVVADKQQQQRSAAEQDNLLLANIQDMEFEFMDITKPSKPAASTPTTTPKQAGNKAAAATAAQPASQKSLKPSPTKQIPAAQQKLEQQLQNAMKKPATVASIAKSPAATAATAKPTTATSKTTTTTTTTTTMKTLPSGVTLKKVQVRRSDGATSAATAPADVGASVASSSPKSSVTTKPAQQLRRLEPVASTSSGRVPAARPSSSGSATTTPSPGKPPVQRLRMTQSQVDAMAREGKIQVKGGQVYLRQKK